MFIRENARLLGMLVVAILTFIFGDFDGAAAEDFLTNLFSEFGFFIGSLLVVLTGYIGERRLIGIEPNQTLTAAVAVVTVLLPIVAPGTDWSSLIAVLQQFAANGMLTFGAVFGVLLNYFSDIRIGRPAPMGPNSDPFTQYSHTAFRWSELPRILATGSRKV